MIAIVRHVKNYGITCSYFVLASWILVLDMQATAQSHTETYVTYRMAVRQVCRQNSREVCSGWWTGRDCNTQYYCDDVDETFAESVTSTRCQSGWSPYPSCNETNECTGGISGCEHICTDTVRSYTCSCNVGYRLATNGRSCNDIDECTERTSECAQICNNVGGSYTCGCRSGYVIAYDRRSCTYVSKCPTATCQHTCNETNGSHTCGCYAGYKLSTDGRSCNDTDECAAGTSGCSDICYNTIGSYTCGCNSGYNLADDRRLCQDVDECQRTTNCSQFCNNTIGGYICSCYSGYALASDKRSCQDIDECTAHLDDCAILVNFTCKNTIGGYQCVCKNGFEQVGPRECRDINECETLTNNCTLYENMTCVNIIGGYRCGRPEFQVQSGSNWLSEETVRLVIVVTVCAVVGVVLIIIAVVCFVKCAKKRKIKKADPTANSVELPAENIYDNVAMTTNSTSVESDNRMADSTETANGQSTSTKHFRSVKGLFKSQKKKDLETGKATSDSTYQELSAVTEIRDIYQPIIREPSNSIDISVPGEANNDSSTK